MTPFRDSSFCERRRPNPRIRIRVTAAAIVLAVLMCPAAPSLADPLSDLRPNGFMTPVLVLPRAVWAFGWYANTYALNNTGFTLEAGEPTEGGVLTRSLWAQLSPTENTRVVIHTFGSEVDTVLAVYTGSAVNALTRVTGNNDFPVPGLSNTGSLVQFDAVAGVTYRIQVGSVGGQQGDILLNVFQFPPGGGVSTFLALVGGSPFNNRDYVCTTTTCFTPAFVVHNSGDQQADVLSSTTFGALFNAPAPLALAPGAAALLAFPAQANTNFTTRTLSGRFVFSGRVGGVETSRAEYPGLVLVRGNAPGTSIVAATLPSSRAGSLNQVLTAFGTIINTGTQDAIGCVASMQSFGRFNVSFQETDPQTNTPTGLANQPIDIPAGKPKTLVFALMSQGTELGDPVFGVPLVFQCANAFLASSNLANSFAVSSVSSFTLADMISIGATPTADGILNVPPVTGGAFGVATVNVAAGTTVTARAVYERPFGEDDPAKQFLVFICETNPSTGACLSGPAANAQFTATPNVPHTFAVFVQRPAVDPGFDPGQRRIFVIFEQLSPPGFFGSNPIPIVVGSTSIAPRAQ